MAADLQQALVLVLAADVDEAPAQLAEDGGGGQLAGDVDAAAPAAPEHPPYHQPFVAQRHRLEPEPGHALAQAVFGGAARGRREHRLDARLVGAGADEVGARAAAAEQRHRVEDQRLARSGLAGEHGHAGPEGQLDFVEDGKIADA